MSEPLLWPRRLRDSIVIAGAYFGLGLVTLRFFAEHGLFPAPLWLPAAVAFVAVVLRGVTALPGIALGAFLINRYAIDASTVTSLVLAAGNSLGPYLGWRAMRRLDPSSFPFARRRAVAAFVIGGVILHALVTSLIGATVVTSAAGLGMAEWLRRMFAWWLCDTAGALLAAPAFLALLHPASPDHQTPEILRQERFLIGAFLLALALLFFLVLPGRGGILAGLPFLLSFPALWLAWRHPPQVAQPLLALSCTIALIGAVLHRGVFYFGADSRPLETTGLMAISLIFTSLVVGAMAAERRHAARALREANRSLTARVEQQSRKLQTSEQVFETVVQTSPDAILMTNLEGTITFASPQTNLLFGLSPDVLLEGMTFCQFLTLDTRALWANQLSELIAGNHPPPLELTAIAPQRPNFTIESNGRLLRDGQGNPRGAVVVVRDVEERRRLQLELQNNERRFRMLAETAPFALVFARAENGEILFANREAQRLLGVDAAAAHAPFAPDFYADPDEWNEIIGLLMRQGTLENREIRLRDRQGRIFWAIFSAVLSTYSDGPAILISVNDITARKALELTLRRQLEEIRALQATLQEQAVRDGLTGLFNRRYLDETLEREIVRANRDASPVSVIMLDMDHFKNLNDRFGHKAGDAVLQKLGEILRDVCRASDVACRYGGEEFALILPGATLPTALERAESIRRAVEALTLSPGGNLPAGAEQLRCTVSLGVASFPEHGTDGESLIQQADRALYAAKGSGRNRAVGAPPLSLGGPKSQTALPQLV
ncbi:hypothetical protein OTERR_17630 [Oryzomicrobium terrae]|uniref:diguanylate cyclase n=1 Tax=Oryzomicrobium terrae TaxID=1735038 RepID=A0A5C1E9D3_9RHOO|nr:diguanylate cyclase [Oryzomicrobium terrae]QEL65239.1 hypothetical protein OTERR_17630 [Oryzomicrobium terrae]